MTSEDMKLKKFEMLIRDIDKELKPSGEFFYNGVNPLNFFINRDPNNVWLEGIFNNTFLHTVSCSSHSRIPMDENEDIMNVIERIRLCNNCHLDRSCNVKSHLLFWLIFIVSIDNTNYHNNLNIVSDVAYILGFSEEHLADWITAVKGILSGKKLHELTYKTEEGVEFFCF